MEVYNRTSDDAFTKYVRSILDAKMLEVCSTTLPQAVLPAILSHPEYDVWRKSRNDFFLKRKHRLDEIYSGSPGVRFVPPQGAFYISVVITEDLNSKMRLDIPDRRIGEYIETLGARGDHRFVHHLLGQKNICVVPLSSFHCEHLGFRATLLERDDETFEHVHTGIRDAIQEYVSSGKSAIVPAGGVL